MNKPYEEVYAPESLDGCEGLLAIVIRANYVAPTHGAMFFTPAEMPQQLGILQHKEGVKIAPHVHVNAARTIYRTQEVLLMRKGKIQVTIFCSDGTKVKDILLSAGDLIHLVQGGHSLEVLEECDIIEVKSGPHMGAGDKQPLSPRG